MTAHCPSDPAQPPAPAEAATDIGADYDGALPEGSAVALLLAAVALVIVTLGIVHLIAWGLT